MRISIFGYVKSYHGMPYNVRKAVLGQSVKISQNSLILNCFIFLNPTPRISLAFLFNITMMDAQDYYIRFHCYSTSSQ